MILKLNEIKDITANYRNVQPGSIYFDFTQKRRKKELIQAYKNGASLIYTEKNISDPDMPVIKTDRLSKTFFSLLQQHYTSESISINFIAVTGSKGKTTISDMLKYIFNSRINERSLPISVKNDKYLGNNHRLKDVFYIEEVFKNLNYYISNKINDVPIIVHLDYANEFTNLFDYHSSIFTNLILDSENDEEFNSLKEFYNLSNHLKIIFINIDDTNALKIIDKSKNFIPITYGLNSKAVATATSIDYDDGINFNYSLQRNIITVNNQTIEPFEYPIKLKILGNYNIYNALAAITCALYYDIDIDSIARAMEGFSGVFRSINKFTAGEIIFIDHSCSCLSDYDEVFKSVQTFDYKKVYILLTIDEALNIEYFEKIADIICQWSNALNVTKVILTSCMEHRSKFETVGKKQERVIQKQLKKSEIACEYFTTLDEGINDIMNTITKDDIGLILGGEELNCIQDKIKDKFIKKE